MWFWHTNRSSVSEGIRHVTFPRTRMLITVFTGARCWPLFWDRWNPSHTLTSSSSTPIYLSITHSLDHLAVSSVLLFWLKPFHVFPWNSWVLQVCARRLSSLAMISVEEITYEPSHYKMFPSLPLFLFVERIIRYKTEFALLQIARLELTNTSIFFDYNERGW
jgi:hypothetical protein